MRTHRVVLKHAPRLLITLTVFIALSFTSLAPVVSADDTASYEAQDIEEWLEDAISGTEVTVTTAPSADLSTDHRMVVEDFVFQARDISVGLNFLRFTFNGSRVVDVAGELDVFGHLPRFWCDLELEYLAVEGKLQVASISNIEVATFTPSLSSGDLDTIVDVLNQILDSSELSISSPGGDLTGIDVLGGQLETTWTGDDTAYLSAAEIADNLDGMVTTLAGKATAYLQDGEGDWTIDVNVLADTALEVDAAFTAFGVTASLDSAVTFDTLAATIENATFSIGTGTQTVGFSAEAEVGCSDYVPSLAMTSLTLGDDHPGLRDLVADMQEPLLDAINQSVDSVVADTGLEFPYSNVSEIEVVDNTVVLHKAEAIAVPLPLEKGWNLVFIPVTPVDLDVDVVFPGNVVVYTWDAGAKTCLEVTADVEPGRGYWVAMNTAAPLFAFQGAPLPAGQTIGLAAGWNIVGVAASTSVEDLAIVEEPADDPLQRGYVYGWNPTGRSYGTPATNLVPGKGYWLASIDACTLYVTPLGG